MATNVVVEVPKVSTPEFGASRPPSEASVSDSETLPPTPTPASILGPARADLDDATSQQRQQQQQQQQQQQYHQMSPAPPTTTPKRFATSSLMGPGPDTRAHVTSKIRLMQSPFAPANKAITPTPVPLMQPEGAPAPTPTPTHREPQQNMPPANVPAFPEPEFVPRISPGTIEATAETVYIARPATRDLEGEVGGVRKVGRTGLEEELERLHPEGNLPAPPAGLGRDATEQRDSSNEKQVEDVFPPPEFVPRLSPGTIQATAETVFLARPAVRDFASAATGDKVVGRTEIEEELERLRTYQQSPTPIHHTNKPGGLSPPPPLSAASTASPPEGSFLAMKASYSASAPDSPSETCITGLPIRALYGDCSELTPIEAATLDLLIEIEGFQQSNFGVEGVEESAWRTLLLRIACRKSVLPIEKLRRWVSTYLRWFWEVEEQKGKPKGNAAEVPAYNLGFTHWGHPVVVLLGNKLASCLLDDCKACLVGVTQLLSRVKKELLEKGVVEQFVCILDLGGCVSMECLSLLSSFLVFLDFYFPNYTAGVFIPRVSKTTSSSLVDFNSAPPSAITAMEGNHSDVAFSPVFQSRVFHVPHLSQLDQYISMENRQRRFGGRVPDEGLSYSLTPPANPRPIEIMGNTLPDVLCLPSGPRIDDGNNTLSTPSARPFVGPLKAESEGDSPRNRAQSAITSASASPPAAAAAAGTAATVSREALRRASEVPSPQQYIPPRWAATGGAALPVLYVPTMQQSQQQQQQTPPPEFRYYTPSYVDARVFPAVDPKAVGGRWQPAGAQSVTTKPPSPPTSPPAVAASSFSSSSGGQSGEHPLFLSDAGTIPTDEAHEHLQGSPQAGVAVSRTPSLASSLLDSDKADEEEGAVDVENDTPLESRTSASSALDTMSCYQGTVDSRSDKYVNLEEAAQAYRPCLGACYKGSPTKSTFRRLLFGCKSTYHKFELDAIERLRQMVKSDEALEEASKMPTPALLRNLQAHKWDCVRTAKSLKHLLSDEALKPFCTQRSVRQLQEQGFCYPFGRDRHFRPILVFRVAKIGSSSWEAALELTVYWIEYCIENLMADERIEQFTVIVDLKDISMYTLGGLQPEQRLRKLCLWFPCRLNRIFFVDAPRFFWFYWNTMIRPSIPEDTAAKISMLNPEDRSLFKYISQSQVEKSLGGKAHNMSSEHLKAFKPGLPPLRLNRKARTITTESSH